MTNPKEYEKSAKEKRLWEVLDAERDRWGLEKIGEAAIIGPESLWPDVLMDRMVDWAHEDKLKNMEDFRRRISWAFSDEMGPLILDLIKNNYNYEKPAPKPPTARKPRAPKPQVPPPPLFSSAPRVSNTHGTPSDILHSSFGTISTNSPMHPSRVVDTMSIRTLTPTPPAHFPPISSTGTPTSVPVKPLKRPYATPRCTRCKELGHKSTSCFL